MTQLSVEQAANHLNELLDKVAQGQKVVITRADGTAFTLIALEKNPKPTFGSAKGLVWLSDDFDAPLEDFGEYMP